MAESDWTGVLGGDDVPDQLRGKHGLQGEPRGRKAGPECALPPHVFQELRLVSEEEGRVAGRHFLSLLPTPKNLTKFTWAFAKECSQPVRDATLHAN